MGGSDDFALPDCRDAAAYDGTMLLTRLGWAWEFLRRNSAFREDLTAVLETTECLTDSAAAIAIRSTPVKPDWGVLFRQLIWQRCRRFLVTASLCLRTAGYCSGTFGLGAGGVVRFCGIAVQKDHPRCGGSDSAYQAAG